jgi:hypothetical protein
VNEAEEVSNLIGDIYDASLDAALWPVAFEKGGRYIGGGAVALSSQDLVGKKSNLYFSSGHDPDFLQRYLDKYCNINPLFPAAYFFEVEKTLAVPDCLPREEFCRTRFAVEWVLPQGIVDTMLSNIEKSPASCAVFTVMIHARDGFANDEKRRRSALVIPHVRRALLIGKVIDHHKVEAAALADSLDALASAMFIVGATGRIVHANASGYASWPKQGFCAPPTANFVRPIRPPTRRCWTSLPQPEAATRCSAGGGSPSRSRRATTNAISPMCCR